MSRGVIGIEFQHLFIHLDRLHLTAGVFLEGNAAGEKIRHIRRSRLRADGNEYAAYHSRAGREIEQELPGDGFDDSTLMAEGNPVTRRERSRLKQRILHSRHLLLHGFERLPDHRRTHFAGAQVAHFLDLQKLEKRIAFGCGHQSSFFPSRQLARREPKNAKQICPMISIHVDNKTRCILSGKLLPVASGKWATMESKQATCSVAGADMKENRANERTWIAEPPITNYRESSAWN